MAADITEIEEALQALWTGLTVTTLDRGAVAVPVYIDHPDPEENEEEDYPSIAVLFSDLIPEFFAEDSEEEIETGEDTSGFPFLTNTRRNPYWYRIVFELHCYSRDAAADRAMVQWIETRKTPKDSFISEGRYYWLFRTNFQSPDEKDGDVRIYHKVWDMTVLADLENTDTDGQVQQIHEVRYHTGLVKTYARQGRSVPVDENNEAVSAEDAVFIPHRIVAFDESDYWFPVL
jgi:hypothetical protein